MNKLDIVAKSISQKSIDVADHSRTELVTIRTSRVDGELSISGFPHLEVLYFESDSPCLLRLYELPKLRRLTLTGPVVCNSIVDHTMEFLQIRKNAEVQGLHSSKRISIQQCQKLQSPVLLAPELTVCLSVSGVVNASGIDRLIRSMDHLSELYLWKVSFNDWSWLSDIPQLQKLTLMDCGSVSTLDFIINQQELKSLNFGGTTTIVTGDLSNILLLIKIEFLLFKNRSSYNARLARYDGKPDSFSMKSGKPDG